MILADFRAGEMVIFSPISVCETKKTTQVGANGPKRVCGKLQEAFNTRIYKDRIF